MKNIIIPVFMLVYILQLFFSLLISFFLSYFNLFSINNGYKEIIIDFNIILFFIFLIFAALIINFTLTFFNKINKRKLNIYMKNMRFNFFSKNNINLCLSIIVVHILYTILYADIKFNNILIQSFLLAFIFFMASAFWEEFIFRGFYFYITARSLYKSKINFLFFIFFQALIFSIVHINNPNLNFTHLLNIFLGGIFLGLLAFENFKLSVIFHFFWNFIQSVIFGLSVSSHQFKEKLFVSKNIHEWEKNIFTSAIFVAAILYQIRNNLKNEKYIK
ncbi:MAG: CPBP family intramembrane metalloprotease [Spirochaetia bacterium]|nr:CPBP family intramembrane metalloprotease [Spirochaetia bacterium]